MAPTRRILHCTLGCEPGPVGGAERQAMRQAKELARRGYVVEMVCPRAIGTEGQRIDRVLVHRLLCVDRRPFRTATYLLSLSAWLLVNLRRYDLVHVHLANLQADVVGLVSRWARVPMYVKIAAGGSRGEVQRLRTAARLTRYVGIRSARRVQAISDEIAADLLELGIPIQRIVRIPNGYATEDFSPIPVDERNRLRRELDLPHDRVLVLYAGRFATYKGVLDLLEAWRSAGASQQASLVMVGEQALDAPIGRFPTGSGVILRSWSPRIADYYRACDGFVLPSHVEGMSNSLLEAMACGMAVIATRVGAAPAMIEDGVTGLLVDAGAIRPMSEAIHSLVSDAELRAHLGARAATSVASRYGIGPVVDRIATAYEEILSEVRN